MERGTGMEFNSMLSRLGDLVNERSRLRRKLQEVQLEIERLTPCIITHQLEDIENSECDFTQRNNSAVDSMISKLPQAKDIQPKSHASLPPVQDPYTPVTDS